MWCGSFQLIKPRRSTNFGHAIWMWGSSPRGDLRSVWIFLSLDNFCAIWVTVNPQMEVIEQSTNFSFPNSIKSLPSTISAISYQAITVAFWTRLCLRKGVLDSLRTFVHSRLVSYLHGPGVVQPISCIDLSLQFQLAFGAIYDHALDSQNSDRKIHEGTKHRQGRMVDSS
jgi:hypothetical protein